MAPTASEVTRHDPVLQRLFGFQRMANFKAAMRFYRKFSQALNERVLGSLYGWLFRQLAMEEVTLDLDSTVRTGYGERQGACLGYNPAKPERPSHPPLMAFVADTRMVANFWLRPGNTHTANNALAFLESALSKLLGRAGAAPACRQRFL